MKKKSKADIEEADIETSEDASDFGSHARKGASDLMIKHLNGVVIGLNHFLQEREKAHAGNRKGGRHTLKHIAAAHRKYQAHTHHATSDFLDHLLEYEKGNKK